MSSMEKLKDLGERLFNDDQVLVVRGDDVYKAIGERLKSTNGWAYYQDSTYTSANPLVSNNAKTQILIDGLGSATNTEYLGRFKDHWVGNKILTENVADNYLIRLDWKVRSAANNVLFDVVFDIGDESENIILEQTHSFRKGDGGVQRYSKTVTLFALETFKQNGCKVYIDTTDSGANIDIFDMAIKIERTYI